MKRLTIYAILLLSFINAAAQSDPTLTAQLRLGGSEDDKISSIRQTSDGGYIIAGSTESEDFFLEELPPNGGADFWVVKLSFNLTTEWSFRTGGTGDDKAELAIETTEGNYVVGGTSNSPASALKQNHWGGDDIWLVMLDNQGLPLWESSFGGAQDDTFTSVYEESNGAFVVGGSSKSGASGNKTSTAQAVNFFDYWLLRIDQSGTKFLDVSFGGTSHDVLNSMEATPDGGALLGGTSQSLPNGTKTTTYIGGTDFWVLRLNGSFEPLWDFGSGTSFMDPLATVRQLNDGSIVVAGTFNGLGGLPTHANYKVIKLNSEGTEIWNKTYTAGLWDEVTNLDVTNDGGFILSGYSNSGAGDDKEEEAINAAGGMDDFWIIKLDSIGNIQWQNTIGGFNSDQPMEMHQTTDGGYVIGGMTNSGYTADVEAYPFDATLDWDWWIVKMNSVIPFTVYPDNDGDGYGDPIYAFEFTDILQGVLIGGDCDDNNPNINPSELERCNGIDDDCDGLFDEDDFGYSAILDGTNDYLDCSGSAVLAPTNQITIECWAYRDVWSGTARSILSKTQTGGYSLATNGTSVTGYLRRDGQYATPDYPGNLTPGWHHLALTYDGKYTALFVDGVEEASDDAGGIFPIQYSCAGNDLLIGAEPTCSSVASAQYFNGRIDEVRIWSYARSASQIALHANHEIDPTSPGLISYLRMFPEQVGNLITVSDEANGPGATAAGEPQFFTGTNFNEGALDICNGVDDNCDGTIDEGFDADGDGASACQGDCNDNDSSKSPFEAEVCNSIDDDCDGEIDEQDFGNAVQLNGTTDYINCGNSTILAPTTAITLEVWAHSFDWSGGDKAILSKTQSGGYSIYTDGVGLVIFLHLGGTYTNLYHTMPLSGGWHHIAVTFDGRYSRLYVDGVQSDEADELANVPITYQCNNNFLLIGGEPTCGGVSNGTAFFNGKIDEVRVWSYARSATQIQHFSTHELSGNEDGLLAYWNMNEAGTGPGNVVNNLSDSANLLDGTTVGNTTTFVESKIFNTATTYYTDLDLDGFGDPNSPVQACTGISIGAELNDDDCDDANATIFPGAAGTHQNLDNNCNGTIEGDELSPIPGDFDNNGAVNSSDLLLLMGVYGCTSSCGIYDMDGNGTVNTSDLILWLALYG